MNISPFLKAHQKEAEELFSKGKIGQILFSGGTYQIEVKDEDKSFWPFLQLGDTGKVLDCFCSCVAAEKKRSCPHLAAAFLQIFNEKQEPLHVRFRESLWNQLCQIASRRHGYDTEVLSGDGKGGWEAKAATGKSLFFIRPLTKAKKLEEILFHRAQETEETSLKFSNLSIDELTLWREGRPSHELRYELSFWSDLAKWWMLLQEEGKSYRITFEEEESLPKWIKVRFDEVECGFYIAEVNWAQVAPSLVTVKSPLAVYEFAHQRIKKITYDPLQSCLIIDQLESGAKEKIVEGGQEIGDWIFIPRQGFFPSRIDPLLKERIIPKQKIASVFIKHLKVIQKYLQGTALHKSPIIPQYLLSFDAEGTLKIQCYLFEKGDLQRPLSASFGSWVYLENKGFYLLESPIFEGTEKSIPKFLVSDFITRHRLWLNRFEGFQPHVASVEAPLEFSFDTKEGLKFEMRLDLMEEPGEILDLGDWIFVKGKGFYSKASAKSGSVLRMGLKIPPSEVSSFIHAHKEELEGVSGFFSSRTPLEKSGLNIFLKENRQIVVQPAYFFVAPYTGAQVAFVGDFTFVAKEGFHEIPPQFRLPDMYLREKTIDPKTEAYFVSYELEWLRPFVLSIDPKLAKPKQMALELKSMKKDLKSKTGLWIAELVYRTEMGEVSVFDIAEALQASKRHLFTPGGLIILKDVRFNWLKGMKKKRWLKQGRQLRLTALEWMRLSAFESIKEPGGKGKEAVATRQLLEEFKEFKSDLPLDLEGLESDLRAYQKLGVQWLWFLYCHKLSGLLCDEMGLGKTHQAMALLAAAINHNKDVSAKYLVVCPTSVIFHWEELLKRFLPKARVSVFYGAQRSLEEFKAGSGILLTSYGVLRSEKEALGSLDFDVAIFDEVQIAKNSHSQTHKVLKKVEARVAFGLSGTPIENHLIELKALFDLILPSYFPNDAAFRELFVNPIEKNQDPEKKLLLNRLVKPFLLRRRKADVLLELPEKIEEISYCPLSEEQKALYRDAFLQREQVLMHELKDKTKPLPLAHIFALLSKLKQICDHPSLVLGDIASYHKHESGKWNLFVELLEEARQSNQKVVVFSQYLEMLDIIESYLKEKNIGFAGIRGSTTNRKKQLECFRDDPSCEVFVASLQAAGVGIDLVAASVVIHYDRWWNPAKENQATDRVHRIGQSRGVQVFKMVTKHTIEEHIHYLIEKKLALLEGVIGFDEHDQIKGLKREELEELLRLMHKDISQN